MNVPDKHKKLAHAWVDGAAIEVERSSGKWTYVEYPSFDEKIEYRIKPKKVRFYRTIEGEILFLSDGEIKFKFDFANWLTDWVDYVG